MCLFSLLLPGVVLSNRFSFLGGALSTRTLWGILMSLSSESKNVVKLWEDTEKNILMKKIVITWWRSVEEWFYTAPKLWYFRMLQCVMVSHHGNMSSIVQHHHHHNLVLSSRCYLPFLVWRSNGHPEKWNRSIEIYESPLWWPVMLECLIWKENKFFCKTFC